MASRTTAVTTGEIDARSGSEIPEARLRGRPLVLMLDVDGTLAPIAAHPSLAAVPADTRRTLAHLAAREDVRVALVSGRAAADARRMVAVGRAWVIGNHGAEVMHPNGDLDVNPEVARFGDAMDRAARALGPMLASMDGVILENKRWTLSVHYRMAHAAIIDRLRLYVEASASKQGLRVAGGKQVFEIRPPVRIDKGTAVLRLAEELGGLHPAATLLYAGDDETDEDAFRALRARVPRAITIHVGAGATEQRTPAGVETFAEFQLRDPPEMKALLERLADRKG
jgi:trehalose-phosphatase